MSITPVRQRKRAVKLFYCGTSFFAKNLHREWMPITDGVAKHYLIRGGFRGGKSEHTLTEADNQLLTIRERDCVTFAGAVSGFKPGLLVHGGNRILVTRGPLLPIAKKGAFPLTEAILSQMLGPALPYVLEWHRQAYLRIFDQNATFLPALALAGESGTGKSMLSKLITAPMLGGRVGKPFRYFCGGTEHNADICGAELLVLDDVPSRLRAEKLTALRDNLKPALADQTDSLHPKGRDAFTVPVIRAMMILLNDEQHNLRLLDFSDTSMDDKFMLLRILARPDVLPNTSDANDWRDLETRLRKEIPHLLWHLLHDFKMPKSLLWQRGQPCYRDPELVSKALEDDNVTRLLWLVNTLDAVPEDAMPAPEWDRHLRAEKGALAERILDAVSIGHVFREAAKRFPLAVQMEGTAHKGLSKWQVSATALKEALNGAGDS